MGHMNILLEDKYYMITQHKDAAEAFYPNGKDTSRHTSFNNLLK